MSSTLTKLLNFSLLVLITLLTVSCGGGGSSPAAPQKSWTILVYMAADNSLSNAVLTDLDELQKAAPSSAVNIILQVDRQGITTKRYRISGGQLELLAELGELNMAGEQTITSFLTWAKDAYPADHTALILWDHGNGWDELTPPTPTASAAPRAAIRSMLTDTDNNASFLANFRIRRAIAASGIKLDLLGFDGCNMATIEALYEYRGLAPVLVASEELIADTGWDYNALLSGLAAAPAMSAEDFGRLAVTTYRTYYESLPGADKSATLAAFRSSGLNAVAAEVNSIGQQLIGRLDDPATRAASLSAITSARAGAQVIDPFATAYVYVDMVDLCNRLGIPTTLPTLTTNALIAEYHGSSRPAAHGISIVFFKMPQAATFNVYDPNYKNYDPLTNTGNQGEFINSFQWDEFLARYYFYAGL